MTVKDESGFLGLPLIRNTCGIPHWMSWQYWPREDECLFHIRHSNGDYLITLFAILEILSHVKNSPNLNILLNTGGFLPPISEKWWWRTLHMDSEHFFGLSLDRLDVHLKKSFIGVQFRCFHLTDWEHEPIVFEISDDQSGKHTLSLSVLVKILYVAVRYLRLLPEPEVDSRLTKRKDWFQLAFKAGHRERPKKSNLLVSERFFPAQEISLPLISSIDFSMKDWNYA